MPVDNPTRPSIATSKPSFSKTALRWLNRRSSDAPSAGANRTCDSDADPAPPGYENDAATASDPQNAKGLSAGELGIIPWLQSCHCAARPIRIIHNPNLDGGVNTLDELMKGSVPGLGEFHIKAWSNSVSLLHSLLTYIQCRRMLSGVLPHSSKSQ